MPWDADDWGGEGNSDWAEEAWAERLMEKDGVFEDDDAEDRKDEADDHRHGL